MSLPVFSWVSHAAIPPGRWDLRLLGWDMVELGPRHPIVLDWREPTREPDWRDRAQRAHVFAIGVDDSDMRAQLIAEGVADALPTQTGLVELAARLLKCADRGEALPRYRIVGPLTLDLFFRDARKGTRWLRLHPREFALLWRLAETPSVTVSREQLLADVWRLASTPETNSLEVHVSRLRAKLAIENVGWLVCTDPAGGYRIGSEDGCSFAAFGATRRATLDRLRPIGKGDHITILAAGETHAVERQGYD